MQIIYEDNHLIVVNKAPGEIVQGDKTGDQPLSEAVALYLKQRYNKPGNAFVGVVHRLDRPVGGLVIFAKTSKALERMNQLFREGKVEKHYWAIVANGPSPEQGRLIHWLKKNEKQNKSYASNSPKDGAKRAELTYRTLAKSKNYTPIKGDLKYGAPRSNPDASISLLSYQINFEHPVSHLPISLTAPLPPDPLWQAFVPTTPQN